MTPENRNYFRLGVMCGVVVITITLAITLTVAW